MRYLILHYHILKNAGATIEEILHSSFHGKFLRFDTSDRNASVPSIDLLPILESSPHLKALSSHQIRHPVPVVPGFIFLDMCFLRDPIDRVRSMYDYFRDRPVPGDPVSDLANHLDLGPFVERLVAEIPWYANDIQVNLLANGINNDPPEPKDLDRALQRMFETSFLGVVDHFNESVAAGQYFLNPLFPDLNCAHPPVNVSNRTRSTLASRNQELKDLCDPDVFSRLLSLNRLDFELVEQARAEVRRRFERLPNQQAWFESVGGRGPSEWLTPPPQTKPSLASPVQPPVLDPAPGFITRQKRLAQVGAFLKTELFDAEYYRKIYPDVSGNPLTHFVAEGAYEGRNPHPLFDTAFYLSKYPDVAEAGLNPLGHYLKHGAAEGRQPHPLFDAAYYLERYPDVRQAGVNPLIHYLLHGAQENRRPHRWFDPEYYLQLCEDARRSGGNPLLHFLGGHSRGDCNPHPLFDCDSYLRANPAVAEQGINPLVNWLRSPASGRKTAADRSLTLEVDEVKVVIELSGTAPSETSQQGVLFWRDSAGRSRFIAPPQQCQFFASLSYDQLYAQMDQ